jgi:hypothetical protein
MPLPEGYAPRKGDELLIRVVVRHDYDDAADGLISVAVVGAEHRALFANLDKVHAIYCRAWNDGDRVESGDTCGPCTVLAVHAPWVWIKEDGPDGSLWTIEANELEPYVEPTVRASDSVSVDAPLDGAVAPLTVTPITGTIAVGDTITGPGNPYHPDDGKIVAVVGDDDDIKF